MNAASSTQRGRSLEYTESGDLRFRGPCNAEFASRARALGGRPLPDDMGWVFPLARRFPDVENVVRTAARESFGECPDAQCSDAMLFESWDEAMDAAIECGYLDSMLAGCALS